MVEAVAQEFGRVLKQYGGYLEVLLDDFASRYVSSGASFGFSDHVWSGVIPLPGLADSGGPLHLWSRASFCNRILFRRCCNASPLPALMTSPSFRQASWTISLKS